MEEKTTVSIQVEMKGEQWERLVLLAARAKVEKKQTQKEFLGECLQEWLDVYYPTKEG